MFRNYFYIERGFFIMKDKIIAWIKAAGIRAIKTAAQCAITVIGTSDLFFHNVNWVMVGSAALLSAVLSLITSLAGLPELKQNEAPKEGENDE